MGGVVAIVVLSEAPQGLYCTQFVEGDLRDVSVRINERSRLQHPVVYDSCLDDVGERVSGCRRKQRVCVIRDVVQIVVRVGVRSGKEELRGVVHRQTGRHVPTQSAWDVTSQCEGSTHDLSSVGGV